MNETKRRMEAQICHRPDINNEDAQTFVETTLSCTVTHIQELRAFEDRNFYIEIQHNKDVNGCTHLKRNIKKIILKVIKSSERCPLKKWNTLKNIMSYLQQNGFTNTHILFINETLSKIYKNGNKFVAISLNYLSGSPLFDHWKDLNRDLVIENAGEMVANLHNALQNLDKSMLEETETDDPWKLDNAAVMLDYLDGVEDTVQRKKIETIITNFCSQMKMNKDCLTSGIIHGDLSDVNIIVNCQDNRLHPFGTSESVNNLFGLIDFSDMCVSYYVFEVAQIIRDFMVSTCRFGSLSCHYVAANFLTGYFKQRSLNRHELDILFITIMAGLCQYYVIGEFEFKRQPENEYSKMGSLEASQLITEHFSCSECFKTNLTKHLQEKSLNILN